MRKSIFALLVLAISLFGTQCWAQSCTEGELNCHTFTSTSTTFTYTFGINGSLRVEFVGGVLRNFDLRVTVVTLTDAQLAARLDPKVFPPATTTCFHYGSVPPLPSTQTTPGCQEYAFTGNAGGPNGVPVKNVDYGPPINLTLTYFSSDLAQDPAFGHAPGESTTFSEDILVDYIKPFEDDTMDGSTPSLSSVIALNKKLEENDTFCWISPNDFQKFNVGAEVQVTLQLFASGPCIGNTGTSIRDNFARLSVARRFGATVQVLSDEGGKDFQFDNHDQVNEREFGTAGLTPGFYFVTVRSTKFPPQTREIQLVAGP